MVQIYLFLIKNQNFNKIGGLKKEYYSYKLTEKSTDIIVDSCNLQP